MSAVWNALKKTLNCKPEASEVYEPKPETAEPRTRTRARSINRNSCCNPGSKIPLSIRSSDLINPFTNLVRLSNQSGGGSPYVANVSLGSRLANYFNGGLFHDQTLTLTFSPGHPPNSKTSIPQGGDGGKDLSGLPPKGPHHLRLCGGVGGGSDSGAR
ncbi:hypothetical protein Cgig2_004255 [Carnegiea gigantea]|uniref:Uncharacterized protein n=1 Tax=Carnegiea gigantea TaxID=171969 RepID=A0A9Q1KHH5_9CARY|nr:hypothetical protein Cgig2_004255 [Carnegiea gigantea]